MAILNRFLKLLELLEQASEFVDFLATPVGKVVVVTLFSHQALLLMGCDAPSAAILSIAVSLTLHCGFNRPTF